MLRTDNLQLTYDLFTEDITLGCGYYASHTHSVLEEFEAFRGYMKRLLEANKGVRGCTWGTRSVRGCA